MKTNPEIDRGFYIAGWLLILAAVVYALIEKITGIRLLAYYPPCAFHLLTGWYCPGCGGTRAVRALLHGRLLLSLRLHPFVPYTFLLGTIFMVSQTIVRFSHGKIKTVMHFRMIYLWIGLAIILINCIVQNTLLIRYGIRLPG